ncbi:invertase [Caldalkalibacillus thermarum]|uniref:glycoside hydrolase family 32 protein n=1 Tax=Caldalkalibacillus thermarum TaxID=296745 RepID=UPI00166DABF9|nr:glycoside hydrolase family 32 protein [Caldalkalibacillus thermarum]GGK30137.1 invertase [Caldalkalibacillus thermarum]
MKKTVNHMDNNLETAQQFVEEMNKKISGHPWRPVYHVSPPANWMNDPNGFCFFKGEYHLFYQHHPFSPEWGPMYWGHVKSKDLVFWEHLPIALAPGEAYDKNGCFSGSAIEKDGKLYIMYTGNVWTGPDHDKDLQQTQALAVSDNGVRFTKLAENPVIAAAPEGDIHPHHFRDPKVWEHEGQYYAVIGSKTKTNQGQALLFRSPDLINWEFVNVMAKGEGNFGFMWECPDFFHLDGQDVLVMSPQGMKPEGIYYHNLHQSGYVIGTLNYETGQLSHGPFQLLDYGFDFYAPQTTIDNKGRRILIAWMDMWESPMPTQSCGWAGAMTLPRLLRIKNGQIVSTPVPELERLRENEVYYTQVMVEGELALEGISGDHVELELVIDAQAASRFGLKLRVNEERGEETVLTYTRDDSLVSLDRNRSGQGPGGIRQAEVPLENNQLHLRCFIDKSSVEIFINGGTTVMTARVYPSEGATGIRFFADQPIQIINLKKWDLKHAIININ